MIVNVEYRCPECEKVFNCPANLASHRRWHKPKDGSGGGGKRRQVPNDLEHPRPASNGLQQPQTDDDDEDEGDAEGDFGCEECGKRFRKMPSLRKHLLTHELGSPTRLRELPNNVININNNNTSANSKSYSIAELLSPRKRDLAAAAAAAAMPDLLATPGNILSHLATAGHHFHHRPPPPLISIATALSTASGGR